jgi:excisionase family DNA binding protein
MERRNERRRRSPRDRRDELLLPGGNSVEPVPFLGNDNTDEILTVADAANFLKISRTSVRRLQQRRAVPFIKVGGSVRFAKSDLRAFLVKRRVEAIG